MATNKHDLTTYSTPQRGSVSSRAKIIAVGGGKGGVGKSFVSSNIAIFLANMGYKTVLVDLDLGAANAHTTLGEGLPKLGISDFLKGRVKTLEEIAVATSQTNLRLISDSHADIDAANVSLEQLCTLMSALFNFETDYLVLDLSAGTHQSTIDFFLMAQHHLVVFTPEPSSIENAYRFMKSSFFRKVKRFEKQLGLEQSIKELMEQQEEQQIRHPADLVTALLKREPERGQNLVEVLNSLQFNIILNQTRIHKDIEIGHSVQSVSNKFFGIPARFIGHLDYDNAVWQSLRKRKPLLVEYPHSRLYTQILNISKSIAYSNRYKAVI
ncbi:MAG: P-loop NTPase [Bdellovibrionales bacterium]|nr:P-loop NTPase [Bdellovibrionales bacterium]